MRKTVINKITMILSLALVFAMVSTSTVVNASEYYQGEYYDDYMTPETYSKYEANEEKMMTSLKNGVIDITECYLDYKDGIVFLRVEWEKVNNAAKYEYKIVDTKAQGEETVLGKTIKKGYVKKNILKVKTNGLKPTLESMGEALKTSGLDVNNENNYLIYIRPVFDDGSTSDWGIVSTLHQVHELSYISMAGAFECDEKSEVKKLKNGYIEIKPYVSTHVVQHFYVKAPNGEYKPLYKSDRNINKSKAVRVKKNSLVAVVSTVDCDGCYYQDFTLYKIKANKVVMVDSFDDMKANAEFLEYYFSK